MIGTKLLHLMMNTNIMNDSLMIVGGVDLFWICHKGYNTKLKDKHKKGRREEPRKNDR